MPRDLSGNYTLPLGNPVVDGTIIDVGWANPTMSDIATQLNNVLTRDNLLGPTDPFEFQDGSEAAPGATFAAQLGTGMYRSGSLLGFSYNGTRRFAVGSTGSFAVGAAPDASMSFRLGKDVTGNATTYAICSNGVVQSDVTTLYRGILSEISTVASAFTLAEARLFDGSVNSLGAGSSVTLLSAFYGGVASGTGRWNHYNAGTASNYFNGTTYIGTPIDTPISSGTSAKFQLSTTSLQVAAFSRYSNDATGAVFALGKSRSAAIGSFTVVQNGDVLGDIRFAGSDGTDLQTWGASIQAIVNGTPGANDLPTALVFSTTPDGSASPTQRLYITPSGHVLPATDNTYTLGDVSFKWSNIHSTIFTGALTGNVTGNVSGTAANVTGIVAVANGGTGQTTLAFLRNYLAGLDMSTAGSSATFSVAAGVAADSANAFIMQLAATSKTTSSWAVGSASGGLDTGAIANNTWYHVYVIRRPDTGVVDVVFSTNASVPTLPANYTQYRRIGSLRTNGSAQWTKFHQFGSVFYLDAAVESLNTANPGSAAISVTMFTPLGVVVKAKATLRGILLSTTGITLSNMSLTPLSVADVLPADEAQVVLNSLAPTFSNFASDQVEVLTNTSSQIRSRVSNSDAGVTIIVDTVGWTDYRGAQL